MSSTTPQWKQRRLAARAVRIAERRATQSPAVAAFLATLVPRANAYMAAYDKARARAKRAGWAGRAVRP